MVLFRKFAPNMDSGRRVRLTSIPQLRLLCGNLEAYAVQLDNGKYADVRQQLTNAVLAKHLRKEITVGTYTNRGAEARTLVFDIDNPSFPATPTGWSTEVDRIRQALSSLGIPERSQGVEFSGGKGYHIWIPCAQYVPAALLRKIGRAALALAEVYCEVFPKQDEARDLGNLVKLPGSIHRVTGNENNWITSPPQPVSKSVLERIAADIPEDRARSVEPTPQVTCLAKIQEGVDEGGRNHALFHLAAMCRRAGIAERFVTEIVRATAAACAPPVEDSEVDSVLRSSLNAGPICSTLPRELRCDDCPVLRPKGLYSRPGQLRHGSEGELAVVELGKRRPNGSIEIIHPDLDLGLVKPK